MIFQKFRYWLTHDDPVLSRGKKAERIFLILFIVLAFHWGLFARHRGEADSRNKTELYTRHSGGDIEWYDDSYQTSVEETEDIVIVTTAWREWWSWPFKKTLHYTKEPWEKMGL